MFVRATENIFENWADDTKQNIKARVTYITYMALYMCLYMYGHVHVHSYIHAYVISLNQ